MGRIESVSLIRLEDANSGYICLALVDDFFLPGYGIRSPDVAILLKKGRQMAANGK